MKLDLHWTKPQKAMLQCNKIFEGTKEEIKKELSFILEKFPLVEKMLVPTTELAEKKDKVKTTGNVYKRSASTKYNQGTSLLIHVPCLFFGSQIAP